jgi:5-methylthioadenosine/S-adenosylhomocysteine deaminase
MDAGVNIALATDNMTEDMFQAMTIGSIVHRGSRGGGICPAPQEILDGVTRNGALSLGRLDELGSLEAGKKADITVIDLDNPSLRPAINLVSNIVHYGHPGIVDSVMVDGEFVMRDRKVLCMNEREVVEAAQAAVEGAWRRLHEQAPDVPMPESLG